MSGFLALMNAGEGDINKLSSAIDNCDGCAAGMAETMQDNFVAYYSVDDDSRTVTVIRIFYGGRDVANIVNTENE